VTIKWFVPLRALPALVLFAPLLILADHVRRTRPPISDWHWTYLGLGAWIAMQILAFAYGRTAGAFYASRYHDILLIGTLLNAACLIYLLLTNARVLQSKALAGAAVWVFIVAFATGQKALDNLPRDLGWRRDTAAVQTENVKRFLLTGDKTAIEGKAQFDIPYSDVPLLISVLSEPSIRTILTPVLLDSAEPKFQRTALSAGRMLLPVGIAFLLLTALGQIRTRVRAAGSDSN